jgi:hypothetical protein
VIGRHSDIGNGWDILPNLVTFVRSVASTATQIAFSYSADPALVGFRFPI